MEQDVEAALYSGQVSMDKVNDTSTEYLVCDICGKVYTLSDMACDNICIYCVDKVMHPSRRQEEEEERISELGSITSKVRR